MPNYLLVAGNGVGVDVDDMDIWYFLACGCLHHRVAEGQCQLIARDSYTLKNLYCHLIVNTMDDTTTVQSRVNGGNGNQVINIPTVTTGTFEDAANTDALVTGDLFDTKVASASGSGTTTFTVISYILSTVTNTTPILATVGNISLFQNSTRYIGLGGEIGWSNTEVEGQYRFRVAATLSNLRVYLTTNNHTTATTARTRVNGGNGNQSVSIGAGATGAFEDAVNTDNIASGDNVNYQVVTGITTTSAWTLFQVKSNSAGRQVIAGLISTTTTLGNGLTRYLPCETDCQAFALVEARTQTEANAAFNAKNMYVYISANTLDGATTFRLRKNSGNSNLVVSVGAGLTGQFEDIVNTDSFVAADLLNWSVITGGTGGTIAIHYIGFELEQPAAPPTGLENKSANMGSKMIGAGFI